MWCFAILTTIARSYRSIEDYNFYVHDGSDFLTELCYRAQIYAPALSALCVMSS